MLIFLSWSGDRSKQLAEALKDWLPLVIQAVQPWVSSKDIPKGSRWGDDVASSLGAASFGIVCVTPENREEPWLLFEAGALSKTKDTLVGTLLLGLPYPEVKPPLAQFNWTETTKDDIFKLIQSINDRLQVAGSKPLPEPILRQSFEAHWPKLEKVITALVAKGAGADVTPERTEKDLLAEILDVVRRLDRAEQQESNAYVPDWWGKRVATIGELVRSVDPERYPAAARRLRELQRQSYLDALIGDDSAAPAQPDADSTGTKPKP